GKSDWRTLTSGAYCFYIDTNDIGFINKFGALYNWYAVTDGRNIAPSGWRVPTYSDWAALANYLMQNGYSSDTGYTFTENKLGMALAAKTDWLPSTAAKTVGNDLSKNNSSGFAGFPGGQEFVSSGFLGEVGCWWTSSTDPSGYKNCCQMSNQGISFYLSTDYQTTGKSVRLLKQ
ncbi:MAG: FISUMP domain-containing protein, partial [Chitinivibrionales bacterium]|nr:FISUMP domain-containing protein [Chitinivibrionales bacterium]